MILVDTSIWIELLNGRRPATLHEDDLTELATCAPVLQEVFQGLKPGPASEARGCNASESVVEAP